MKDENVEMLNKELFNCHVVNAKNNAHVVYDMVWDKITSYFNSRTSFFLNNNYFISENIWCIVVPEISEMITSLCNMGQALKSEDINVPVRYVLIPMRGKGFETSIEIVDLVELLTMFKNDGVNINCEVNTGAKVPEKFAITVSIEIDDLVKRCGAKTIA